MLSGCIYGPDPFALAGAIQQELNRERPQPYRRPSINSSALRNRLGEFGTVGIVVPPYFLPARGEGHMHAYGEAVTVRTAQIDHLVNRLGKEVIRLAQSGPRVALLPLQSGEEVESAIQSKTVDWVMEFQITFEITGAYVDEAEYPANHAIMRARLMLRSDALLYDGHFDCSRAYLPRREWIDDEGFWAIMDKCPESLAQEIVEAVFDGTS
jgi:hypothetical protein